MRCHCAQPKAHTEYCKSSGIWFVSIVESLLFLLNTFSHTMHVPMRLLTFRVSRLAGWRTAHQFTSSSSCVFLNAGNYWNNVNANAALYVKHVSSLRASPIFLYYYNFFFSFVFFFFFTSLREKKNKRKKKTQRTIIQLKMSEVHSNFFLGTATRLAVGPNDTCSINCWTNNWLWPKLFIQIFEVRWFSVSLRWWLPAAAVLLKITMIIIETG